MFDLRIRVRVRVRITGGPLVGRFEDVVLVELHHGLRADVDLVYISTGQLLECGGIGEQSGLHAG